MKKVFSSLIIVSGTLIEVHQNETRPLVFRMADIKMNG